MQDGESRREPTSGSSGRQSSHHSSFFDRVLGVLRQSGLFTDVDEKMLVAWISTFRHETWQKKSIIVHPYKNNSRLHIIVSGRVKMTKINAETGREFTFFLLGAGDCFDVVALLDGREHDVMVTALDDLETISEPFDLVRRWFEEHQDFTRSFMYYLGSQMRVLSEVAADVALYDTEMRLARLFLRHLDPQQASGPADEPKQLNLIADLSHEELASMIGSVRVVVNRHLQTFKDEGSVVARRGHMEIKDISALHARPDA